MLPFQVMNSEQKIDQLTHLWNLLITFLLAIAVPHTRKKMLHKERRTIGNSTSVTLSCHIFTNHIHRHYSSTSLMTLSKINECCWRTPLGVFWCFSVLCLCCFFVALCTFLIFLTHSTSSRGLFFLMVGNRKQNVGLVEDFLLVRHELIHKKNE